MQFLMYLIKLHEKLSDLHGLIEKEVTGTPNQLAWRLGVSDRTVKSYIAQLRILGADICYCSYRKTYYYSTPVIFRFGFETIKEDDYSQQGGVMR